MAKATKPRKSRNQEIDDDTEVTAKPIALPVIVPPSKALSLDVGPAIVEAYNKFVTLGNEAKSLLDNAVYNRGEAHALGIPAVINIFKNTAKIDPADVFEDARAPKAKQTFDAVKIGLDLLRVDDDNNVIDNPDLARYFTPRGAEMKKLGKDSEAFKARKRFTSNFQTFLKDLCQEAVGLMEIKANVKLDNDTKQLMISGPKVKEIFGENRVTLDGRREYTEGKRKVKLAVKPSFVAVRDIAAQAHGATLRHNAPARTSSLSPQVLDDESVGRLVNSMIEVINRLEGKFSDEMRKHFRSLQSTLEHVL